MSAKQPSSARDKGRDKSKDKDKVHRLSLKGSARLVAEFVRRPRARPPPPPFVPSPAPAAADRALQVPILHPHYPVRPEPPLLRARRRLAVADPRCPASNAASTRPRTLQRALMSMPMPTPRPQVPSASSGTA